MSEGIVERLRDLLAEKFKIEREEVELHTPAPTKTLMIVRSIPYGVFISLHKDGRVKVDSNPMYTRNMLSDYLYGRKYRRKCKMAKTEEERERVYEEEHKEVKGIIEDFRQGRFEKYFKKRGIAYSAKKHIWGVEVAKRISDKYGFEVKFDIDYESGPMTAFDSTGMGEEQMIKEVMRRVDAIADAIEMFVNKDMMNEFLVSRGIEPVRYRRRRR